MQEILVQMVVLLLVALTATIKSLRFAPSELTDFELQRQVKKGRDAAIAEERLRHDRPLLLALQRLIILLLIVVIIVTLRSTYNFIVTILFACLWLIIVELLCVRRTFRSFVEELEDHHQLFFLRIVNTLRPGLRFVTEQDMPHTRQATFYSKDELIYAMEHDHGVLTKDEISLIRQALIYSETTIKDVMMPRSKITTIEKTDTIGPVLLDRLHKSGRTYFPVVHKDLDHIEGILSMDDLIPPRPAVKSVSDAMSTKVFYVNQDDTLDHALHAFLHTRHHLFIVVNEFEETTGAISIEEILEQIIGRTITDGFDRYEDLRSVAKRAAQER